MLPVLLRADNWTPPERTPWGGRAILERWKVGRTIDPAKAAWPAIGESWELSFDPALPSRDHAGTTLADHLAADPRAWLGREGPTADLARSFLIKLLDAREALSVQVHPADGDPDLAAHESGKPEAWVVLARAPGAGLWLGLADGVTREDFARALDAAADPRASVDPVAPLLNFVPVEVGDAFVIDAGTVHAVGPGVTLLEPQLVRPGRTGVTYRFWDWGRRFDAHGRPDPRGELRALHRARSLAVTAWHAPRGAAFVASCRRTPELVQAGPVSIARYFEFKGMRLERVQGHGPFVLPAVDHFRAILVMGGELRGEAFTQRAGEMLAVPAASGALRLELDHVDAWVASPYIQ